MRYPHRWVCRRQDPGAPGEQDPDTGQWVPGGQVAVYDGAADCQDEGEAMSRDSEGRAVTVSDAVLYLEDESRTAAHRPEDVGTVTFEDGSVRQAKVAKTVRLDGKLHLRWL